MRIVGIGDPYIPADVIDKGLECLKTDHDVSVVEWKLNSVQEFVNINLTVEQGGAEVHQPEDYVIEACKDADIIVTQFFTITKKLIDSCPNLKAVCVLRGGYENINLDYLNEKNILVFNTPGRNANAVADFTLGMILSECRNIAKSHYELKQGRWNRNYPNSDNIPDLCDKTVGIIGYGNIGRKVAQRLKGFETNIVVYDPYLKDDEDGIKKVSLEELFKISDIVTIHSRLTKETEKMVNKELLSLMKPTAYFINTARSGLVDEDALTEVLKDHKIAGAAVDVFEVEPPEKDYKFIGFDNVTVTPHLAGSTKDAFSHSPVLLAKQLQKVLNEHEFSNYIVNKNNVLDNEIVKGLK